MGGSSSSRDCKPGKAQLNDFCCSSKLAAREVASGSRPHDDLNIEINERVWCRANEAMTVQEDFCNF
jgi:hypothetical protein